MRVPHESCPREPRWLPSRTRLRWLDQWRTTMPNFTLELGHSTGNTEPLATTTRQTRRPRRVGLLGIALALFLALLGGGARGRARPQPVARHEVGAEQP